MTAPTGGPPPQVDGLTPTQVLALIALIEAQAALRAQLTQAAVTAAVAAFAAIRDWWTSADIDRAIAGALRVVQPAQRQAARITDAYLARAATAMLGRTVRPVGAVDVAKLRRRMSEQVVRDLAAGRRRPAYLLLGEHQPDQRRVVPADTIDAAAELAVHDGEFADPRDPYGRVADQYRYQVVAQGNTETRAREKALVRVSAIAETDVTLAVREQVRRTMGTIPGVTGYRRIVRPELSESGPCGLCVVAADRKYKVQDLKPIHDRCVCEVLPIVGKLDPGLFLNASDLNRIYDAAGSTGGGKRQKGALKRIRVALAEHGELGPVLVDDQQHYRDPVQVAKAVHPDRATQIRAQLDALDESFGRLTRRALAGEDVDRPIAYHEQLIGRLQRELASL